MGSCGKEAVGVALTPAFSEPAEYSCQPAVIRVYQYTEYVPHLDPPSTSFAPISSISSNSRICTMGFVQRAVWAMPC